MRKSLFLLSIIAAISVVAAEAPAAQAAFQTPEQVAIPDNFASSFESTTGQTVIPGEKFQFQVSYFYTLDVLFVNNCRFSSKGLHTTLNHSINID